MSDDKVRDALAEALAEVMTDADCASPEFPFSDLSRARAILASDVFATIRADAWDAGWDQGYDVGYTDFTDPGAPGFQRHNPYRTEATPKG